MVKRVAGMVIGFGMLLAAQTQMVGTPHRQMAEPGAINYVEGQASLNGRAISRQDIGQATAGPGQTLATENGRAEMLLTPGVFLRLSDHSSVRMIDPSITNTRVEVLSGTAMLEAAGVEKENHLVILDQGLNTPVEKRGIYEFRADHPAMVRVYDGEVTVRQDDRTTTVGKGHELVAGVKKAQKFDRTQSQETDQLYAWSKLRSEYEAEANQSVAQTFAYGAPGWYGAGWYWDPYWSMWGFLPGDGFLYSPFGWGWGYWSPGYFGAYFPYGFYGRYGFRGYPGFVGRPGIAATPHVVTPRAVAPRVGGFAGGARMGGFAGGARMGGFSGGHMGGGFAGGRR